MTASSSSPEAVAVTVIRPSRGWMGLDLAGLWDYRKLLYFLLWRDLKVRYKQTVLGASWAVVQPVGTALLCSVVFGKFAGMKSDSGPYFLSTYTAMLGWNLFSGAINRSGTSLVTSANLISKVYVPRLIVPISAALGAAVDFLIAFGLLLVMMPFFGQWPTWQILLVPLFGMLVLILGTAVGTGLSAVNVRFRDVSYLIGFLLQLWFYASPVAFSASIVPEPYRPLYVLNPMVGCVQGLRWSILGTAGPVGVPLIPSLVCTAVLLVAAAAYFRRVERSFADLI